MIIKTAIEAADRRLLLHSCCAPCSSSVLERLVPDWQVTVFYFNPNIATDEEYIKRKTEQQRLIGEMFGESVGYIDADYDHGAFLKAVAGHESDPEGGARCAICFRQRLERTAETAKSLGIPTICTTLTVSPLKNADVLNAVGNAAAERSGLDWLESNFKKKDGYKRSIELSRQFGLYRQNYCGCEFSKRG